MAEKAKQLESKDIGSGEGDYKKKENEKRSIYYIGKFRHQVGAKFTLPELKCLGDEMLEYMDNEENIWLRAFFTSKERRISPKTIPGLCNQSEYFAFCYEIAMYIQEERLFKLGLKKNNATAIFALKAQHNWKETGGDDPDDHELIVDFSGWPTEKETEEAKKRLKDSKVKEEMIRIAKEELREEEYKRKAGGSR